MIIDRNVSDNLIDSGESVSRALEKIDANEDGIIFVTNEDGAVEGVMTDGDFRRWLTVNKVIDITKLSISAIAKKTFTYCTIDDNSAKIRDLLTPKVLNIIPILDKRKRCVAIARKSRGYLKIGKHRIGKDSPVFVIGEIGNNHNGDFELAKKLVDACIASGADCAKFQLRDMKALYSNQGKYDDPTLDLGSQYTLELLSKNQLATAEMYKIFDYCHEKGITPLCTAWDTESVDALEAYGVEAYKVASADLINHDLLTYLSKTGKPLLCSTGMSSETEITESIRLLKDRGAQFALLHCNSTYPAPFRDLNLNYIKRLEELSGAAVGYSSHDRGFYAVIGAVCLGAKIVEKHITLDRNMEGIDHRVSLEPSDFKEMVEAIRCIEMAMGKGSDRKLSQGEVINRENLGKSLVAKQLIAKNSIITEELIECKSPGKGLAPYRKKELIGKTAKRDFNPGDVFFESDLSEVKTQKREFAFNRSYGVPVRYHDFKQLSKATNVSLLEFHMSYHDLDLTVEEYLKEKFEIDLVVHAPELFKGEHILDLCALDIGYRDHSLREMQRVCDVTCELQKYFKPKDRTRIIVNVGGFSQDKPINKNERFERYRILAESLSNLDCKGVEILPQTMPPFPWHFGGQRFHNLFVDPDEIVTFCREHKISICLDVSHSKLSCNHFGWSFSDFLKKVGPYTSHLHIADSKGVDGEGLQVGEGDIDFSSLAENLAKSAPNASFIPEIWQGHKNDGEGFWIALNKLEGLL